MVTVVQGLSAARHDLPTLLSDLKSRCGAGGTIQDDNLEIQGDHQQRLAAILAEWGCVVK